MNEQRWVILGNEYCKFCDKVKELLTARRIPYVYYDIDPTINLKSFMRDCGLTTVPQVYLNGHLIGGFSATQEYLIQDDLMKEKMEIDFTNNPSD